MPTLKFVIFNDRIGFEIPLHGTELSSFPSSLFRPAPNRLPSLVVLKYQPIDNQPFVYGGLTVTPAGQENTYRRVGAFEFERDIFASEEIVNGEQLVEEVILV